ncbi:MAG: YfhO family protein, partial [Bacteroidia bacterium]
YGQYTIRGKSDLSSELAAGKEGLSQKYATDWSYGVGETMTLLIPNFYGGASNGELSTKSETYKVLIDSNFPKSQAAGIIKNLPLYWGDQPFTSGPVYLGAIICFLFVLGLFTIKGNDKWWLLAAAILSIVLSWGKNFPAATDFFFTYFPGYNKFRAVSMTLVIAQFVFPVMGLLALKNIFSGEIPAAELKKKLIYSLSIVGGICLFFVLMPGMFFDFISSADESLERSKVAGLVDAIRDDRKDLLSSDALRSLVFILLSGAILWLFMLNKLKKEIVMALFAVLVLVDMLPVDLRYLNKSNFVNKNKAEKPFTATEADKIILEDKDPNFRVLNLAANTFNDASTSYFHKSIGGYHGAKLKRFQELIDQHISKNNIKVLNMLNTKYVIMPGEGNRPALPQQNPGALGNAWFVYEINWAANPDSEITALGKFEPKFTAVIDKQFEKELNGYTPQADSTAQIKLTDYKPNHLTYQSKATAEQLAVFSEIYYDKGWNAYIDGKLTPHFRANFVLRAMRVPAGEHKVEFKFEPATYYTGEKIALAGSVLLFLFVGAALFVSLKDGESK